MTECIKLELEGQDWPHSVLLKSDVKLAKRFQALLPIRALLETGNNPTNVRPGSILKKSQEQIFFAFEVRVDRPLASVRSCSNLIQLSTLIAVAHEHFFCGIQKPGAGFAGSKLLFTLSFHGASLI